jgi:hypothetical protein
MLCAVVFSQCVKTIVSKVQSFAFQGNEMGENDKNEKLS